MKYFIFYFVRNLFVCGLAMPRQWKGKGSNKTVLFLLICYNNNHRPSGQSHYYHQPLSPLPQTNLQVKRLEPGKEGGENPRQRHAVNL